MSDKNSPGPKPAAKPAESTTVGPKPAGRAAADPGPAGKPPEAQNAGLRTVPRAGDPPPDTKAGDAPDGKADEPDRTAAAKADAAAVEKPAADEAPAQPCRYAADVLVKLGESGTGADKLACVRKAMKAHYEDVRHAHLAADDPRRHLDASGAVAALEAAGFGEGTVRKARCIADLGRYIPAAVGAVEPHDDTPMPPPAE